MPSSPWDTASAFGHSAVEMLMRRAGGIKGIVGNPRRKHLHQIPTASDLVERQLARSAPNQLWVVTHRAPAREGKIYCAVVLDTYSRRLVGCSIDSSPNSALVTNALGMASSNRSPSAGGIIHSDHGTRSIHVVGIHPAGQRFRPAPVDGIHRRLL